MWGMSADPNVFYLQKSTASHIPIDHAMNIIMHTSSENVRTDNVEVDSMRRNTQRHVVRTVIISYSNEDHS